MTQRHLSAVPDDPQTTTCRYIGEDRHVCQTSHGAPLRAGQTCFSESLTQLAESIGRASIVDRQLAEQERNEADATARLTACERWEDEIA